jgi:alanyl-tRNA synthetase
MTERIYYIDSGCRAFDATVTRTLVHDGRPAVVLSKTAFYPTSGGQPFDSGRLDRVDVVETVDVEGDVVHLLASPIAEGAMVHGEIDWPRRFDHMQQHTGQHVLSAAFDRLFDDRTVSFHMGAESSTIDLARELTMTQIESAVDEANRIVWDDRPVCVRFVPEEEAKLLPLRKEPRREGTLRLIEVSDFDLSACGGTHVPRTGVIGAIAVTAAERFKGGSRVTFVCGGRAVRALRAYRDAVAGSVRILSVLPAELPATIDRLQAEAKDLRRTIGRLQDSLAVHEATRLRTSTPIDDGVRRIVTVIDGWDAIGLKAIATAIVAEPGAAVVLVSSASPSFVVVARSSDIAVDANRTLRQLLERFGGRGGGRPDLAQGGGLTAAPEEIVAAARESLIGQP